jgi:hypothetical protein
MSKLFWSVLGASIAVMGSVVSAETATLAADATINTGDAQSVNQLPIKVSDSLGKVAPVSQIEEQAKPINVMPLTLPTTTKVNNVSQNVTSVSQLSDVQATDWAFTALQSLVERYGCIAGYPDRTYRGQRSLSRYEFAAGLNACLDKINELISSGLADKVSKEDLAALQKLQEEFAAELALLKGRVDALEAKTAQLEAQQFSTTTKLNAEVLTYLGGAATSDPTARNNVNLGYRVRLNFDTSFTGTDRLRTRLQATNLRRFETSSFGGNTDESRYLPTATNSNGQFTLDTLTYSFNIGDKLRVNLIGNIADPELFADPVSPFNDFATGALSNFANTNPIYYPIANRAGLALTYSFNPNFVLDVGYLGEDSSFNSPATGDAANPGPSSGIFSGGHSAYAQLTAYLDPVTVAFTYVRSFSPLNGVDTLAGSNAAKLLTGTPTVGNNFGFQALWKVAKGFQIGGWFGYTSANSTALSGDASVINYSVQLAFPDLFAEGNMLGLVFGQQPRLTNSSGAFGSAIASNQSNYAPGQRADRDTGYHIEAFYKIKISNNISITPGLFYLTAPNHDSRNPGVVVGVIRTAFTF